MPSQYKTVHNIILKFKTKIKTKLLLQNMQIMVNSTSTMYGIGLGDSSLSSMSCYHCPCNLYND